MTVDKLHKAWAKLGQLETQEKYLVERLSHIHKEIGAQKLEIDDLIKGRPPAINRLPTELLSQIFSLCIPDPKFPEKPLYRIVCVSRRWRDVVWNDPSFWTSIKVASTQRKKLLKKQLKRSRKALLDIWIEDWDPLRLCDEYAKFSALLDAIVPHANRWRSIIISDSTNLEFVESIFKYRVFEHLSVPFLREFSMDIEDDFADLPYPGFLSPTHAPTLQHLTFRSPFQMDNFVPPPTLKTLRLAFSQEDDSPPVISMLAPAQSLILLELDGDSTGSLK